MNSTEFLITLLQTTLASSSAMLLVLALRRPLRHWLGASAAYLLWLTVPVTLLVMLLPAPRSEVVPMIAVGSAVRIGNTVAEIGAPLLRWPWLLAALWLVGTLLMLARLIHQQRRFMRTLGPLLRRDDGCYQAQAVAGLPAVVGLLRPRIVLPAGFESRYTSQEQQLVLRHEQVHLRRGDIVVNALLALLHCVYWFNPLLPRVLRRCRQDQELSCDERVIAASAGARRSYGNAMLKTGLALSPLPMGCHWQNHHPLQERIAMLKRPVPGKRQWLAMLLVTVGLSSGVGYAAWAAQPSTTATVDTGIQHAVVVQLNTDGEQQQFELREHAGRPFVFSVQSSTGVTWKGEFRVRQGDGDPLNLVGQLSADGVLVASPTLVVVEGESAGIKVNTPDARSVLEMELRVTTMAANPPAAASAKARISVEPEPSQSSLPSFAQMSPPRYPPSLHTGEVWLKLDVDARGAVAAAQVQRSSGHADLDAAAVEAALKWKLNPGYKDGVAVAGQIRVPVRFAMDESFEETSDVRS